MYKQLDLSALRDHDIRSNLYKDFNYAKEFAKLDLSQVKKDLNKVLTTRKNGGLPIMEIMDHFLFVYLGIVPNLSHARW